MQRLNTMHARRFNNKYAIRGHLHEGRYRALLVDEATYLLRLVRYIHQNPVRASLVTSAEQWPHSSHREYLEPSSWLQRESVLRHFATPDAYASFVGQPASNDDQETFSKAGLGFRYAGGLDNVEKVAAAVLERSSQQSATLWLPLGARAPFSTEDIESEAIHWLAARRQDLPLSVMQGRDISDPARSVRRQLVSFLRSQEHSLRSIGILLNRDVPTISRLLTRAERQHVKSGT